MVNISLVGDEIVNGNILREEALVSRANLRREKYGEIWIACYRGVERLNKRGRPERCGKVSGFVALSIFSAETSSWRSLR